jgi:hypothetical protein
VIHGVKQEVDDGGEGEEVDASAEFSDGARGCGVVDGDREAVADDGE